MILALGLSGLYSGQPLTQEQAVVECGLADGYIVCSLRKLQMVNVLWHVLSSEDGRVVLETRAPRLVQLRDRRGSQVQEAKADLGRCKHSPQQH